MGELWVQTADRREKFSAFLPSVVTQVRGILILLPVQDFGDSGKLYNDMLNRIVRYLSEAFPNGVQLPELERESGHDVSHIIAQIRCEKMADIARWVDQTSGCFWQR